ncbi:MAG: RsmD family RNA methyltransferase, partial [Gammaproteobacteria bacterium]|nr:RsmD family RNA methyltransferase [Gammaproteobacteria bacterium]MDA7969814.1 RsmD family RNA methyltransferase [Gammaproteobacteria bacterium]MDA8024539.1 RsmD family RNA methyltransferase [Gammaproteobacteria bacterium]
MKKRGHIRIIGGRWKSRRVRVAAAPGLRPSADALRETLFNWLPRELDGNSCLDLFAGSGALGFEAASRGAPKVVMVEPNRAALDALRACRASLGAHGVEIFAGTAAKFFRAN